MPVCETCIESGRARGARCRCTEGQESSTVDISYHACATFAYVVVDGTGRVLKECVGVSREGKAAEIMVKQWLDQEEYFKEVMACNAPMIFTEEDQRQHAETTRCGICEERLDDPTTGYVSPRGKTVRDHDHLSGAYLSAAHRDCNLNRERHQNKVVAIAHNCYA